MNHCVLEVKVKKEPTIRYTKDNQTPIAELEVVFQGLRPDDPPGTIKVLGWGNISQEIQRRIKVNQNLVIEGRLRMNTVPRQDGTKEKRAELTLSKFHILSEQPQEEKNKDSISPKDSFKSNNQSEKGQGAIKSIDLNQNVQWDTSPLIPDTDDIPF